MIERKGIPTIYNGIRFRSRLEARWACFFDQCRWRWDYEPFDLQGYIPDFVLKFRHPVLVEVKPDYDDLVSEAKSKIESSGWNGVSLILSDGPLPRSGAAFDTIGQVSQDCCGQTCWAEAYMHRCLLCDKLSFHHSVHVFHCHVCGVTGQDNIDTIGDRVIWNLWSTACNQTQYTYAN